MTHFKNIFTVFICMAIVLFISSCENSELSDPTPTLTEEQALEIIETELNFRSNGAINDLNLMVEDVIDFILNGEYCNTPYNLEIEHDFENEFIRTYLEADLSGEVSCNLFGIPQSATITASSRSSINAPQNRMIKYDGKSEFFGNISGLQLLSPAVNLSGSYNRVGNLLWEFEDGGQWNVGSDISLNLTTLTISKFPPYNVSGVGTLSFTGVIGNQAYPLDGSIVLYENNTAVLTLNGNEHIFDWN